jgi:Leucine-rich repeat (LRR) protein
VRDFLGIIFTYLHPRTLHLQRGVCTTLLQCWKYYLQSDLVHDNTWVTLRENLRKEVALTKEYLDYEAFLQQLFQNGEGSTLSGVCGVMINGLAGKGYDRQLGYQLKLLKQFPVSLRRLALLGVFGYTPQALSVAADDADPQNSTNPTPSRFSRLSNLRTLLLPKIQLASEDVLTELSHTLPHLEELDFSFPSFCKRLDAEDANGDAAATVEFQWSVFPHIKKLTLHCCDRSAVQFRFGGCRHLKQLGIHCGPKCHLSQVPDLTPLAPQLEVLEVKCSIYSYSLVVDIRFVSSLTRLTELDMDGCGVGDDGATYLRDLTKLRRLSVACSRLRSVSDGWCGGLGSLTQLNLYGNQYMETTPHLSLLTGLADLNLWLDVSQVLSPTLWSPLTRLRRLTLGWMYGVEFTVECNLRFLSGFSRLCSVRLHGDITTTSAEYFDVLPTLTSVRELALRHWLETTPLVVLDYLARMTWLESLTLGPSYTAEYNFRFLCGFRQLRAFELGWQGVVDGAYFDFLAQLTSLRELRITPCLTSFTFSVPFLRYLTEMTWLVSLHLEHAHVDTNHGSVSLSESLHKDESSLSIHCSRVKVCELLESIRSRWQQQGE